MRTIVKGVECMKLQSWKQANATSQQNIHYDNLGRKERGPILEALVKEQGWLCAYTLKPIVEVKGELQAHIEHILPRSIYPAQSVQWSNMVACVPHRNASCEYGAKLKDNYDPGNNPFLNPVMGGVAAQILFRENGCVEGKTVAANATIDKSVLNLNHPDLINDRAGKIKGVLALKKKPSASQARRRAQELRKFDINGKLEPYCEVVAQVLEAYALRLENYARRVSGAKRA